MKYIARILIMLMIALSVCPSHARADWREFIPTPYENGADIQVRAMYEFDAKTAGTNILKWRDIFIKEKLMFYSLGHVYHPRFILYNLSVTGALKHENFEASSGETGGWRNASGMEYNANFLILPEHPYKLRLFASRAEPLYKDLFSSQNHSIETNKGAVFSYKKKPYFFHLKYLANTFETEHNATDLKTFSTDGTYFKEYQNEQKLSLTGAYTYTSFSSPSQLKGSSNQFSFSNDISLKTKDSLKTLDLTSNLSKNTFAQESPFSRSLDNDQLFWQERIRAQLPLNFRTDLSYSYQKNMSAIGALGASPGGSISDASKKTELSITHLLYKSLHTTYIFRYDILNSIGGRQVSTGHSLSTIYTKAIPWGRVMAGLNLGRTKADSKGRTSIDNESHAATPVPGSFVLNAESVDPATVRVFMKSTLPPFELILLEENINYTATLLGNKLKIDVLNLPARFILPGTFDFLLTYTLISGNFELQSETVGYNLNFFLFDDIVNPFFSTLTTKSRVRSGIFPAVPVDAILYSSGLNLKRGPFRASAEYRKYDSNSAPYRERRAEVSYSHNITETSSAYAAAEYISTDYPEGLSALGGQGYNLTTASASANISKRFVRENLSLSAGGTYSYSKGLMKASAYSLHSSLLWKIGRFVVSFGASASSSKSELMHSMADSSASTLSEIKSERIHQLYYLNVTRKLF
jgi:hypothetical protein